MINIIIKRLIIKADNGYNEYDGDKIGGSFYCLLLKLAEFLSKLFMNSYINQV